MTHKIKPLLCKAARIAMLALVYICFLVMAAGRQLPCILLLLLIVFGAPLLEHMVMLWLG